MAHRRRPASHVHAHHRARRAPLPADRRILPQRGWEASAARDRQIAPVVSSVTSSPATNCNGLRESRPRPSAPRAQSAAIRYRTGMSAADTDRRRRKGNPQRRQGRVTCAPGAPPKAKPRRFGGASAVQAFILIGGATGNRTPDLLNAIQALSHLSYDPTGTLAFCALRGWVYTGVPREAQEYFREVCEKFSPLSPERLRGRDRFLAASKAPIEDCGAPQKQPRWGLPNPGSILR